MQLPDKNSCCGCSACASACPSRAICMTADPEGFLVRSLDSEKCVGCGLCTKVCPVLESDSPRNPVAVFAVKAKDERVREGSASGGVFTLLAHEVLKGGGIVFGAGFEPGSWRVVHKHASCLDELENLRGSKYVQSDAGDTFVAAKRDLEEGKRVLYSGTPCQIAGLRRFLGRDYDGLLTVEVICHGVPSPLVWKEYVRWKETDAKSRICAIYSRRYHSWRKFAVTVEYERASGRLETREMYDDPFLSSFLHDWIVRKGCYQCPFRGLRSGSDLTIGDFWGVENVSPGWEDEKGLSVVLANTEKGRSQIGELSTAFKFPITMADACVGNNRAPLIGNCRRSFFRPHFMWSVRVFGFRKTYRVFSACYRMIDSMHHVSWWIKRLIINGEINRF